MSFRRRTKIDKNLEQSHSFKKSTGFFSTMRISSKSKLNTNMSADKAFATLDTDGIGAISARALQLALVKDDRANRNRAVTIELSDDDMDRVFDVARGGVDANKDGKLQRDEFAKVWRHFTRAAEESSNAAREKGRSIFSRLFAKRATPLQATMSAQDAFAIFDSDGDGTISIDELKELLNMGTGSVLSDEEVEAIIAEVDVNGNGTLELDEFEQMWKLFGAGAGTAGGSGGTAQRAPARRSKLSGKPEPRATGAGALPSPRRQDPSARLLSSEELKHHRRPGDRSGDRSAIAPQHSAAGASVLSRAGAAERPSERVDERGGSSGSDRLGSSGGNRRVRVAESSSAPESASESTSSEPEVEAEGEWSTAKWLASLGVSKLISRALQVPPRDVMPAFDYVRRLGRSEVERLLNDANLGGLVEMLWDGVEALGKQKVASSAALNDKFQASGKFQMSYGSLSLFYGGLESLLGPPQMHKDPEREGAPATLLKAMENEHCAGPDALDEFTSTNGVTTHSWLEWEIVVCPKKKPETPEGVYPERKGLREHQPECCRVPRTLDYICREMESSANVHLRKANHAEMIVEELIAGRLYTGPMYMKYNAVLRAKSGNPYLQQQCRILCKENDYPTSIHATNSCVLKLSKLTKAGKVWRGIKDGTLPKEFWVPNEMGVRGGIEYGFSSTTTDKKQALEYASHGCKDGDAMTIFEMQMGMVDRGADLTWLSQYPHEREVLLPPLTGIEALTSDVEGSMLVISARLSLNLSAQTLEQVLSRRRKMLMDMAAGIELELRDSLGEANYPLARKILRKALEFGAYMYPPEWFNNDDNFSKVMQETLYLQRTLTNEISQLRNAFDRAELNLRGWKARGPARVMLLSGWMQARTSLENVFIDLRDAELTPDDAVQLAHLMTTSPKLTSIDVRGNDSMGERGASAFVDFMAQGKVRTCNSVPRSINGVTHSRSQLQIPKQLSVVECRLLCAELEANVFSEGVSAGMGESSKKGTATLNRRGGSASDSWQPLLWAAKDNNLIVAEMLIAKGHSVNTREPIQDKGNSGYTPLHWAAHKGHLHMVELLLSHGANAAALDKHSNTPKMLAEKKGEKELVALLEGAASRSAITIKRRLMTRQSSETVEQATRPSLLDEPEPSLFASGWAVPIRDDVLRSASADEALRSMIAPAPLYES